MAYLSSEESRAVTECNLCNILAFLQILWLSWRCIALLCRKQKSVYIQTIVSGCIEFSQGPVPKPTVWFTPLRSTGIQCSQIPCTSLFSPLSCLCAFSCLFLAHRQVQHLKLSSAHPWGLLPRNLLSLIELFAFPGSVLFLLLCLVYAVQMDFLPLRPDHRLRQDFMLRT